MAIKINRMTQQQLEGRLTRLGDEGQQNSKHYKHVLRHLCRQFLFPQMVREGIKRSHDRWAQRVEGLQKATEAAKNGAGGSIVRIMGALPSDHPSPRLILVDEADKGPASLAPIPRFENFQEELIGSVAKRYGLPVDILCAVMKGKDIDDGN